MLMYLQNKQRPSRCKWWNKFKMTRWKVSGPRALPWTHPTSNQLRLIRLPRCKDTRNKARLSSRILVCRSVVLRSPPSLDYSFINSLLTISQEALFKCCSESTLRPPSSTRPYPMKFKEEYQPWPRCLWAAYPFSCYHLTKPNSANSWISSTILEMLPAMRALLPSPGTCTRRSKARSS